jgi:hypothetical protein
MAVLFIIMKKEEKKEKETTKKTALLSLFIQKVLQFLISLSLVSKEILILYNGM